MPAPFEDYLRRQLADARRMRDSGGVSGLSTGYSDNAGRAGADRVRSILSALQGAQGGSPAAPAPKSPQDLMMEERQRGFDNLEGQAGRIMDDPRMEAALAALQGAADGSNPAMSDATLGLMQGRVADMNAAGELNQSQALDRQAALLGMSPSDPAYQAERRGLTSNRQTANAGSMRDFLIQQAAQNYAAQQQAAMGLAQVRGQQFGLANPLLSQAANERFNTTFNQGEQGSFQAPPAYTPIQFPQAQGGGYGQQPQMGPPPKPDNNGGYTPPSPRPTPDQGGSAEADRLASGILAALPTQPQRTGGVAPGTTPGSFGGRPVGPTYTAADRGIPAPPPIPAGYGVPKQKSGQGLSRVPVTGRDGLATQLRRGTSYSTGSAQRPGVNPPRNTGGF